MAETETKDTEETQESEEESKDSEETKDSAETKESEESKDSEESEDSEDSDDSDDDSSKLEKELEKLLEENETFEPPEDFVKNALWTDESIYEEASKDVPAWWEGHAKELHWFNEWDEVLDDSNPPFYKWFTGGKINASYNCLDRHVEDGNGDRVAFHWRGE